MQIIADNDVDAAAKHIYDEYGLIVEAAIQLIDEKDAALRGEGKRSVSGNISSILRIVEPSLIA